MSQDLFRQIGEKLESLFKKKLALSIFRQIGEKLESLFKNKACTFHISPNWREIRVFIPKKSLHFSLWIKTHGES